jgi:transposase
MRGKKGDPHLDPADPPRRRANKVRGHGTWENDRPPILGVRGRDTRQVHLAVLQGSARSDLEPRVLEVTRPDTWVYTDEWQPYDHLPEVDRRHSSVCHAWGRREWARDDDGDGVREVHTNGLEGCWTGLRNFLRPFRGVHKKYLEQYTAIYEWHVNLAAAMPLFLLALLGVITPNAP